MMKGKSFDEIILGENVFCSKTFTDVDVKSYSEITEDFNPIHIDDEYAKQSRFGKRIVHGTLAIGFVSSVLAMKLPGPGTIILTMTFRFNAPVKINDTIMVEAKVIDKIEKNKFVKLAIFCRNQRGEEVINGNVLVLPPHKDTL